MGVSIPSSYDIDTAVGGSLTTILGGSVGSVGPVTLSGIPDTYHFNIDSLPKIQIGVDPLTVNPITMNIAIKEIPSTRTHLPADFTLGLSLFGMELLCVRLCGEAQMINEPYRPNPCEVCGPQPVYQAPVIAPNVRAGGQ